VHNTGLKLTLLVFILYFLFVLSQHSFFSPITGIDRARSAVDSTDPVYSDTLQRSNDRIWNVICFVVLSSMDTSCKNSSVMNEFSSKSRKEMASCATSAVSVSSSIAKRKCKKHFDFVLQLTTKICAKIRNGISHGVSRQADICNSLSLLMTYHRRSQGGLGGAMAPYMFRSCSHFVLWDAVSQTKPCYSPKIKHFVLPKLFWALPKFWAGYATVTYNFYTTAFFSMKVFTNSPSQCGFDCWCNFSSNIVTSSAATPKSRFGERQTLVSSDPPIIRVPSIFSSSLESYCTCGMLSLIKALNVVFFVHWNLLRTHKHTGFQFTSTNKYEKGYCLWKALQLLSSFETKTFWIGCD